MDYLLSAVTHLTEEETPGERSLKYAVLLHAATEVLLKARLVREHWSLVFSKPEKATARSFREGKFQSTTVDQTISRLRDIAGLDIGQSNQTAITKLSETRNAFTHYGHSAPAHAVEQQAVRVLDFLVNFIATYLYDRQSTNQFGDEYDRTMSLIRERLGRIDAFVAERMRDVSAGLAHQQQYTVLCPFCQQYALVVGSPGLQCRFCNANWKAAGDLAVQYLVDVIDVDNGAVAQCGLCDPDGGVTLVLGASTAKDPHADVALCFRCGATYHRRVTVESP